MSPCDLPMINTVCELGEFADDPGSTVKDVAASGFQSIVESMSHAFGHMLEWCLSWWVHLPSPDLTQMSALSTVREYTTGLQTLLMTGAVMVTGARLALAHRGALAGEVQESFMTFARAVLASWMFAAVITVATRAGDGFSDWVISGVIHDPTEAVTHLTDFSNLLGDSGIGSAGMFVLGLLGFIGALLQLALLVMRQALLIVVVAVIPIAASAAGTGPGSQAYKKLISWSIAFVLFKPVGALVYLVAFEAAGATSSDPQQQLLGLILLAIVALVLPALMRMIAPAVSTMGSGGGGVAAAAMLGGGVSLAAATGAKAGISAMGESNSVSGHAGEQPVDNTPPAGGGRVMTAGNGEGSGNGVAVPNSSGAAGSPAASASQTGAASQAGTTAAGASSGAAALGPAGLAIVASTAARGAVDRAGQHVSGEAGAGADSGARTVGQHEVRR